jgi:hypothetical protein
MRSTPETRSKCGMSALTHGVSLREQRSPALLTPSARRMTDRLRVRHVFSMDSKDLVLVNT